MELFIPLRNKLGLARKLTIKDLRKCREDITTILDAEGETIEEIEILSEKEGEYLEMACSLIYIKNKYNTLGLRISIGRRAEGDPKKHEELTDLLSHYDPNYL